MNIGFDASTIALIIGGGAGAFLHALSTKDYPWRSVYTLLDVAEGAALGVLIPLIPLDKLLGMLGVEFQLPVAMSGLTPLQKGAAMLFIAWPLVSVLRERVLSKFQPLPRDRRVSDPKPETKP